MKKITFKKHFLHSCFCRHHLNFIPYHICIFLDEGELRKNSSKYLINYVSFLLENILLFIPTHDKNWVLVQIGLTLSWKFCTKPNGKEWEKNIDNRKVTRKCQQNRQHECDNFRHVFKGKYFTASYFNMLMTFSC